MFRNARHFYRDSEPVGETGSSCYTGKLLQLRFLYKKIKDSKSYRLYLMKTISNQLCTQKLEIIYDNKKKLWPKQLFLPLRVFLFYSIFENSPCATNFQLHLEIDKVWKWSIPLVYIDGIITALCAWVFDWQVIQVKIPPWGKLLQFLWGKLLHCDCNTWGKMEYKLA